MEAKTVKTWHEDDEFWQIAGEVMFTDRSWNSAPQEVDDILTLIRAAPPAAILDLCCGPGRHSIEMAQRGFQVTGVDRTAPYLEMARTKAAEHGVRVNFVLEDMRTFCHEQEFDFAVNLFTSFGYFEDPADNLLVLKNLFLSLRPGGRLLLEMMGREVLARIFLERTWDEVGKILFLQEHHVVDDWSRIENRWILLKEESRYEYEFTHWIYSASELEDMLIQAGFSEMLFYGDISGKPYDQNARRLVVVAQKD